jgi:hypothetical protein
MLGEATVRLPTKGLLYFHLKEVLRLSQFIREDEVVAQDMIGRVTDPCLGLHAAAVVIWITPDIEPRGKLLQGI